MWEVGIEGGRGGRGGDWRDAEQDKEASVPPKMSGGGGGSSVCLIGCLCDWLSD